MSNTTNTEVNMKDSKKRKLEVEEHVHTQSISDIISQINVEHHGHSHGSSHGNHGHAHGSSELVKFSIAETGAAKTSAAIDHGHTHEAMEHPGLFNDRAPMLVRRNYNERSFTVGIGGPVGSGKTALMLQLCRAFRDTHNIAAITNDIFTKEDGEFLTKHKALSSDRIIAIETGGCPHAAIREDISANLQGCEDLTVKFGTDIIFLESGGDNLAAGFSRELADYTIYVIDVAGGDKVPRKGGPGITQSDLLIINKTDLAVAVGADLEVMKRDSKLMRGEGPTVFAQVKHGVGMEDISNYITKAWREATSVATA